MSEKSQVNQGQCDDYQKNVYKLIASTKKELEETIEKNKTTQDERFLGIEKEYATMQGGINFAKYIVPIIVVVVGGLIGAFVKVQTDSIRREIKYSRDVSSGSASTSDWSSARGDSIKVERGSIDFENVEAPLPGGE